MAETIHTLNAEDKDLLNRYCEADSKRGPIGEVFADLDCTILRDGWREIAKRTIRTKTGD